VCFRVKQSAARASNPSIKIAFEEVAVARGWLFRYVFRRSSSGFRRESYPQISVAQLFLCWEHQVGDFPWMVRAPAQESHRSAVASRMSLG
jgi:hypothetical protein